MPNPTVVASQGAIHHFSNMTRFRYTTVGGAPSETVTIDPSGFMLTSQDYIKLLPDPSTQPMAAELIEVTGLRSTANGTIVLRSSDGSTNIPAGLGVEIILIKRQMGDTGSVGGRMLGNPKDAYWGPLDLSGNAVCTGSATTVLAEFITKDSIVWVDQRSALTGLDGGLIENYAARVPGVSFQVIRGDSNDPLPTNAGFNWAVINP